MRRGREVRRRLEADGWAVVVRPGGHCAARHPDVPGFTLWLGSTPSDRRAQANAIAHARRVLRQAGAA